MNATNILTMIQMGLQGLSQIQGYQFTMQKALAEGRDVSPEELAAARSALQTHLDALQSLIDASKGN